MKCPKCGASDVDVYKERMGWGPPEGEPVFACRVCGKRIYGKAVEEEYRRQKAAWEEPLPLPAASPRTPPSRHQVGYMQQARQEIAHLLQTVEHQVAAAIAQKNRVVTARHTMGSFLRDGAATRMMNLLDIEVNKAVRLHQELRSGVRRVNGSSEPHRLLKSVQERVGEIQTVCDGIPAWAEKALDAAHAEKGPPAHTPEPPPASEDGICEFVKCEQPAAPGRRYCGDVCRKRQARWTYNQRQKSHRRQ